MTDSRRAPAGMAGNAFKNFIIPNPVNPSEYFLYHNDESYHSGLHRWRITGLDTIKEETL